MAGDWPQVAPRTQSAWPSFGPLTGDFIIGGDSISQICYGSVPLTTQAGQTLTLANRLANRADVLNASFTTANASNIASGWAHWMEALSGGRCQLIKNGGQTGVLVANALTAYATPSSPYYAMDLIPNPPGFVIQQGAGGDDQGTSSTATVIAGLQATYQQWLNWFPSSPLLAFTLTAGTPSSGNDDTFRRPINQWIRNAGLYYPVTVIDAEKILMNASTGLTAFNQTFTVTIAAPAVFTTTYGHGLRLGDIVFFETTGALPTGLVAGTPYYVVVTGSATTFEVSATYGGSALTTTGSQSGTQTMYSTREVSADGIHQNATGGYDIAKAVLEVIGDHLPHEQGFVNDYNSDTTVQSAQGGWGIDAMMNGTLGVGNTATNWNTSVSSGGVVTLIARDDNYGNWQRVQTPAGLTAPATHQVYRFGATTFPAGAIIHLECEVRWPFADLLNCTDLALELITSGGTTCAAYELIAFGQSPAIYPYRTPPPGERWVIRTTPIVIPSGGVTGQTYSMYFTAVVGTMDVGRFSLVRDA